MSRAIHFAPAVFALACGAHEAIPSPRPQPLPPAPVVLVDAAAPREPACLDAFEAEKPLETDALEAARRAAEPARTYEMARVYYRDDHWVEAAIAFRSVAFDHSDSEMGVHAAQLYLDCLNQLATKAHRLVCYEAFPRDVPRLIDLYCTTRRSKNAEACNLFDLIQVDIDRLRAEDAVKAGDYRAGADAYFEIVRRHCLPPASPQMHCDEIAYNAGAAFIAAGDEVAARGVRALMINPQNGMNKSPLTTKLSCRVDHSTSPACR